MKETFLSLAMVVMTALHISAQDRPRPIRQNIPLDSIILSDPFILADTKTKSYYMTGTGGALWRSADLKLWTGPYKVAQTDSNSWMGAKPMIWAAEIHQY